MRTVFQTKTPARPNTAVPAPALLLLAVTALVALAITGCELGAPADFLRDHIAVVTVKEVQARQHAAVTEKGVNVGPSTAQIALMLDNNRKIPLRLGLNRPNPDDGHIDWTFKQISAGEVLVTINGFELGDDEQNLILFIGADGRDFEPFSCTLRCTTVVGTTPYTVTFDTRGQGTVPPKNVYGGSLLGYPDQVSAPDGKYLEGWYRDNGCTDRWNFAGDTVTGDTTLYAKWALIAGAVTYTVTFDTQGKGTAASRPAPQTVLTGKFATEPIPPTEAGWTFGSWFTDPGCSTGNGWNFSTAIDGTNTQGGTLTLYALWTLGYAVTFNMQGFGTTSAPGTQTIAHNGFVAEPYPAPTAAGKTFGGWFHQSACTTPWLFGTNTVTGVITLYAKWSPAVYTVKFDEQSHGTAPAQQTVAHGAYVIDPGNLSTLGQDFDGWYTDSTGGAKWTFSTPVDDTNTDGGTLNLYARWKDQNIEDFLGGSATLGGATYTSSDSSTALYDDLYNSICAAMGVTGDYVFNLPGGKTHEFAGPITLPTGVNVSLRGVDTDHIKHASTYSGSGELFIIQSGAVLTLRGPTLVGKASNTAPLVKVDGGKFYLRSGVIKGNTTTGSGSGVTINSGTFTMSGGAISGNSATWDGGGVYLHTGAFTMSGGTISGNSANVNGGGVNVNYNGTFTMNGGTISGNTAATDGGGVHVSSSGGRFIKTPASGSSTGGTITGTGDPYPNRATGGTGAAVYDLNGTRYRDSTAGEGDEVDTNDAANTQGFWLP